MFLKVLCLFVAIITCAQLNAREDDVYGKIQEVGVYGGHINQDGNCVEKSQHKPLLLNENEIGCFIRHGGMDILSNDTSVVGIKYRIKGLPKGVIPLDVRVLHPPIVNDDGTLQEKYTERIFVNSRGKWVSGVIGHAFVGKFSHLNGVIALSILYENRLVLSSSFVVKNNRNEKIKQVESFPLSNYLRKQGSCRLARKNIFNKAESFFPDDPENQYQEGWVVFKFNVKNGHAKNIKRLDSRPGELFVEIAKSSLSEEKYESDISEKGCIVRVHYTIDLQNTEE